jgi:hypothetical protein
MVNLILVILSISLTAATLFASLNYLPGWAGTARTTHDLTRYGFLTLEKAFAAQVAKDAGVPAARTDEADGGLFTNFSAYYGYLPQAPKGYAWKYGDNGTDYYFCLYPTAGNPIASEGLWRGLNRVRNLFSDEQYFIVPGGVSACGAPLPATPQSAEAKAPPAAYPALISAVYLVFPTPP